VLVFALLLLTIIGTSIINMILVVALIDATHVYRPVRTVAMNIVGDGLCGGHQTAGRRFVVADLTRDTA